MINKSNISVLKKLSKHSLDYFDPKNEYSYQYDLIYYKDNIKVYYFNYKNLEGYCIKKNKDSYIFELNGFNGYDSEPYDISILIKNNKNYILEYSEMEELSGFTFHFENEIIKEDVDIFLKMINNIIKENDENI